MIEIVKKYNYTIMLGNIYPHDTFIKSSTINAWYIKRKLNYGSIIILHDREYTIHTLKKIIFSLLKLTYLQINLCIT